MKNHRFLPITILLTLVLIFFTNINVGAFNPEVSSNIQNNTNYNILVDLNDLKMFLIDKDTNEVIKSYPIAGGKPSTPSPIGTWTIIGKEADWGKGFGSRWMALNVPWGKYGIHGTNKPLTIGGAESLGCIRMFNKDVEDLYNRVRVGTTVVIYGGPYGLYSNHFRNLIPGDRGADVFEVQRRLRDKGYYLGKLDGVYGDGMKAQVIRFRKDNKLTLTHNIDKELYEKLEMNAFE